MKLRIQGNSLRLRLDEAEVSDLVKTGRIRQSLCFGPAGAESLLYSLEIGDRGLPADADLHAGEIRFYVRDEEARRLESGGETSVEGTRPAGETGFLRVLIERDLAP